MASVASDPLARTQALSNTFEIQCHVCEGFLGAALVAQCDSQSRKLFRLMTITPGADLSTLCDQLNSWNASSYKEQIEDLGSKPMCILFEQELTGRDCEKLSDKLIQKLDAVLADDLIPATVLEPKNSSRETKAGQNVGPIIVVTVEHHNISPNSFIRRLCLARAMQNGAFTTTPLLSSANTRLRVNPLSHFELPMCWSSIRYARIL